MSAVPATTPSTLAQKLAQNLKIEKSKASKESNKNGKSTTAGADGETASSTRGGRGGRGGGFSARGGSRGGRGGRSARKDGETAEKKEKSDDEEEGEEVIGEDGQKVKKHKKPYVPVEKCDKPDEKKFLNATKQAEFLVTEITKKIESISVQVELEIEKRNKHQEENKEFYSSLKLASQERNTAFNNLKSIRSQMDEIEEKQKLKNQKLKGMKKELKFTELDELEEYIKSLEYRIETTSMPLNSEKKLVEEIKQLQKQRDQIIKFKSEEKQISSTKVDTGDLREQLKEAKAVIEKLKLSEAGFDKEKAAMQAAHDKANEAVQVLIDQRKALQEQRYKKQGEIYELKRNYEQQIWQNTQWLKQEEYRKKKEEWQAKKAKHEEWLANKKFREEQKAQRQAEYEARQAEREARKQEWEESQLAEEAERQQAEDAKDPWEEEKILVEELKNYCKTLLPKSAETENKSAEEENPAANAVLAEEHNKVFKGYAAKPMQSKKSNPYQLFGDLAKAPKDTKAQKPRKEGIRALVHVPDVLSWFGKVEVAAPLLSSEVAKAIEQLEQKGEWLKTAPRELKKQKLEAEKKSKENAGAKKEKKGKKSTPAAAAAAATGNFPSITDASKPADATADETAKEAAPVTESAPAAAVEAAAVEAL